MKCTEQVLELTYSITCSLTYWVGALAVSDVNTMDSPYAHEICGSKDYSAKQGKTTAQPSEGNSSVTNIQPSRPSPYLTGWRLALAVTG